jgi:hypothetical protein
VVASALMRDYLERLRRGERIPRAALAERDDEVVTLSPRGTHRARSPRRW